MDLVERCSSCPPVTEGQEAQDLTYKQFVEALYSRE
jgi:hypothetical protein